MSRLGGMDGCEGGRYVRSLRLRGSGLSRPSFWFSFGRGSSFSEDFPRVGWGGGSRVSGYTLNVVLFTVGGHRGFEGGAGEFVLLGEEFLHLRVEADGVSERLSGFSN